MKRVLILTADSNTGYPVPATKGGAVSELVENLIVSNELEYTYNFEVISLFDQKAVDESLKFKNTRFHWVKTNFIIRFLDTLVFTLAKIVLRERSKSFKSMVMLLNYIRNARKILKRNNYDHVIIENNMLLFWALKGLKKYQGKYYYHAHNLPRTNAFMNKTLLNTQKVLTVSDFVKNEIVDGDTKFPAIKKDKVEVLFNRIDLNHFKVLPNNCVSNLRGKYNLKATQKVLLFAGRLSWEKGIDKIIDAIQLLKDENIKLLIVGSVLHGSAKLEKDDYVNSLKKKIEQIGDKVVFTGYISYKDMPAIYNLADIAILPSMWEEPAGLTPIEAMACGTPVITTNSGGIPEYVSDSAIVLNRDNELIENIATEIEKLINNDNYYAEYKHRGLEQVLNYDSVRYAEALRKVLD